MVTMAPGDATLESLVLGVLLGTAAALLLLLPLAQTRAQWSELALRLLSHAPLGAAIAAASAVVALALRAGFSTLAQHVALPAEVRVAAMRRNLAAVPAPARFPNGWYQLCLSRDLSVGATKHVPLLSKDVAIFRGRGEKGSESTTATVAGRAFVVDAVCPHLGANLAVGGHVQGDNIECPFHGWAFAGSDGHCSSIPYAKKIPSNAKIDKHASIERNGAVLMHYNVDGKAPEWRVSQLDQQDDARNADVSADTNSNAPFSGRFHGSVRTDAPGSVHELVTKHADVWSGEVAPDAAHAGAAAAVTCAPKLWGCIGLEFIGGQREWQLSQPPSPRASLSTEASFTLFGVTLSFLRFSVQLLHMGPSLLYMRFQPQHALLRSLLGEVQVTHAVRPDNAFVCAVEQSAFTLPLGAQSLLYTVSLPLQRCVAKLLLRLLHARFVAACLPVFALGRVPPLSLHNNPQTQEAQAHSAAVSPARTEDDGDAEGDAQSDSPRTRTQGSAYRSRSAFTRVFMQRFYSQSGVKQREDLSW